MVEDILEREKKYHPSLTGRKLEYIVKDKTSIPPGSDKIQVDKVTTSGREELTMEQKEALTTIEQEIIEEKLFGLLPRLQRLIEDIALLRTANFISESMWKRLWRQQMTHWGEGNSRIWRNRLMNGFLTSGKEDHYEYEFGMRLGHLARLLHPYATDIDRQNKLSAGFHMGVSGELLRDPHELTDSISDDSGGGQYSTSKTSYYTPYFDYEDTLSPAFLNIINELVEHSDKHPNLPSNIIKQLKEANIPTTKPFLKRVDHLCLNIGSIRKPHEDRGVGEVVVSHIRKNVIHKLEKLDALIPELEEDVATVINQTGRGEVRAIEVLCGTALGDSNEKYYKTVQNIRSDKPSKQNIQKLKNDLKGTGTNPQQWKAHPIVEDGTKGLELTEYGEFISLICIPDAPIRKSDRYLPDAEKFKMYANPTRQELELACHSCIAGEPNSQRTRLFDSALEKRLD